MMNNLTKEEKKYKEKYQDYDLINLKIKLETSFKWKCDWKSSEYFKVINEYNLNL